MKFGRFLLALLLLLAGAGLRPVPAAPRLPSPKEIDQAIERAVTWLLEEQKPRGSWGTGKHATGKTALAVYALLHAGLTEDQGTKESKRLGRALKVLDRNGPGRSQRPAAKAGTYETSLLLMLLRARGRPQDRARLQRLADVLCRHQAGNGQWWYDGRGAPHIRTGDNSNTQFALLALGVAHGEGLDISRGVLALSSTWWTRAAGRHGGFGYASGGSPKSAETGSMTAAGIACLAILQAALVPQATSTAEEGHAAPTRAQLVREKAIAHLAKVFSVTRNDGPSIDRRNQRQRLGGRGWLHYYLWTIERAMVLSGQERLGSRDWYAEGARHLIDSQKKDGSWRQEHPLYATCFALLFLTRAADPPRAFTPRGKRPAPPRASAPTTPSPAEPAEEPLPAEDPAKAPSKQALPDGSVQDWLALPLPVGELAQRCRQAGAGCLEPLVRALDGRDADRRQRAHEALAALLEPKRLRGVDRHPLHRGRLALWIRLNDRDFVLRDDRFVLP